MTIFSIHKNRIKFKNQLCHCRKFHRRPVEITQEVGVMQGDSLSPYLFILYINDVVEYIKSRCEGVSVILYADDMVVLTESDEALQKALDSLKEWTSLNKMKVNTSKTKIIKFRKGGGRFSSRDNLGYWYGADEIKKVDEYVYLGVTLQPTLRFSKHIQRVKAKASSATTAMMRHLTQVSLKSAKVLFEAKIRPIVTYGLHIISPWLKLAQIQSLDVAKSRFLKKALSTATIATNQTIYRLCETKRLCEELKEKKYPFEEAEYGKYLAALNEDNERDRQHNTLAFDDQTWKGIRQKRHFPIGYTVHGFHFMLCENRDFHRIEEECICKFCHQGANRIDHLNTCCELTNSHASLYDRYRAVYSI